MGMVLNGVDNIEIKKKKAMNLLNSPLNVHFEPKNNIKISLPKKINGKKKKEVNINKIINKVDTILRFSTTVFLERIGYNICDKVPPNNATGIDKVEITKENCPEILLLNKKDIYTGINVTPKILINCDGKL
jgi:hypothetical protein